jgi:hypothetical protein
VVALSTTTAAQDTKFFVSTGNTDGKLGALSRRPSTDKKETETADDFDLKKTTVITGATITGMIVPATPLANIADVEVEMYHVFPLDSVAPSGNVPSRLNSPSDVEIASATRDARQGTLRFTTVLLDPNFLVKNTVVNGINKKPFNITHGEEQATGAEVEIDITFTNPILLPAGHYFFRPEVMVTDGDFLSCRPRDPSFPLGRPSRAICKRGSATPICRRIGSESALISSPTPPRPRSI